MSTWICIHCSFWSIASLCAQKADCTERWLRFTSREVAHYYFAPNTGTRRCIPLRQIRPGCVCHRSAAGYL
ncbi:hypothetical protein CFB82_00075 [Burkholderia sp. HI2714]|nr:hypothetical protein CFB82_00075 [Burkholderia sp. HI2714]